MMGRVARNRRRSWPRLGMAATRVAAVGHARSNWVACDHARPANSITGVSRVMLRGAPLLRPEEAARFLSVKPSWIYEAVRTRRLPCVRVGRHIRFTKQLLEEWVAENTDA
jgi:excisionase family DNA binding protein